MSDAVNSSELPPPKSPRNQQLIRCTKTKRTWTSCSEAARGLGVSASAVLWRSGRSPSFKRMDFDVELVPQGTKMYTEAEFTQGPTFSCDAPSPLAFTPRTVKELQSGTPDWAPPADLKKFDPVLRYIASCVFEFAMDSDPGKALVTTDPLFQARKRDDRPLTEIEHFKFYFDKWLRRASPIQEDRASSALRQSIYAMINLVGLNYCIPHLKDLAFAANPTPAYIPDTVKDMASGVNFIDPKSSSIY